MGSEVSRIAEHTHLTPEEVAALRPKFQWLAQGDPQDRSERSVLEKPNFVAKFPVSQRDLAELIFHAMDGKDTGTVSFASFCEAVAALSLGDPQTQATFAFGLYDRSNRGFITKDDVAAVIHELHRASQHVLQSIGFQDSPTFKTRTQLEEKEAQALVQSMPHNSEQLVSKEQFVDFCVAHPEIFEQLSVVFSSLRHAAGWAWEEGEKPQTKCSVC
jgi:Ca2+-binding EF-hand superfamily protein